MKRIKILNYTISCLWGLSNFLATLYSTTRKEKKRVKLYIVDLYYNIVIRNRHIQKNVGTYICHTHNICGIFCIGKDSHNSPFWIWDFKTRLLGWMLKLKILKWPIMEKVLQIYLFILKISFSLFHYLKVFLFDIL
jgi:hypothetical protein